jgi:ferredoxin-NADP reductase/MOSC domain-containing protein YiiM
MPGRVVSVNVGLPREVRYQGRTVRTGIFKEPVTGRVHVSAAGLAGDGQADLVVHGGAGRAVYAYPAENLQFWRASLGLDELAPGWFGENLTLAGLTEDTVHLGERIRVGSALLEVREPRTPCFKLGIRLGCEDAVTRFLRAGRPGYYLSVVEPGQVWAGAAAERQPRPAPDAAGSLTVAEAFRLYVSPTADDLPALRAAVGSPVLSPDLRGQFGRHLTRLQRPGGPAWAGFRPFTVTARHRETLQVVSLLLRPGDGGRLPAFHAGQHVAVELRDGHGTAHYRSYSLSRWPGARGDAWTITVRRDDRAQHGATSGSALIHDQVRAGDSLAITAPQGSFTLDHAQHPDAVLVAGGVGLTPLLAMAQHAAATGRARQMTLLYGARTAQDLIAPGELARLSRADLGVQVFLSRHGDDPAPAGLTTLNRRITGHDLARMATGTPRDFYLCGPGPMVAGLTAALRRAGVDERAIHTESFTGNQPAATVIEVPDGGREVTFTASVHTMLWTDAQRTVLDLAEAAGITVPAACRAAPAAPAGFRSKAAA